jgi:hypothetical protein
MKTMKKKYCCTKCDKKTLQTNCSEGFTGSQYYLDYACDECGGINTFLTKKHLKDINEIKN